VIAIGEQAQVGVTSLLTPSSAKSGGDFPADIVHLLEILARIERRRQARLREIREGEKHSPPE